MSTSSQAGSLKLLPDVSKPIPKKNLQKKNPAAVALGRLGGLKGGKARAAILSPRRRKQIAKQAALARWTS